MESSVAFETMSKERTTSDNEVSMEKEETIYRNI